MPVEKVTTGFEFTEGPVYSRIGFLLFSDIRANRIIRYEGGATSVLRENSNGANGLTFDHQGRLLTCEGRAGRVTRTEKDGSLTVLADRFDGKLLHAPNDLVYSIDGSIYFTDIGPRKTEVDHPDKTGFGAVYQITRLGDVRMVDRGLTQPNGVALGPNQLTLYVADYAANSVWAFDVEADGSLANKRALAHCEGPDGLKTDEAGNLYVAEAAGISVFSPGGELLETIVVPERPANCNWGPGFRGLYITARTSVYFEPGRGPGTRTY